MLIPFLAGAVSAGFLVAGLFFLRFWKKSRDGLFAAFAIAFWLLGLSQALLTFSNVPVEERSWLFLLRLAAFVLILAAIWRKNAGAPRQPGRREAPKAESPRSVISNRD